MIAAGAEGTRQKEEKTERMIESRKVELFFKFISPTPKQMALRLVLQSIAKSSSLKIPIPISRQQSKKERCKKEKGNNHFEKRTKKAHSTPDPSRSPVVTIDKSSRLAPPCRPLMDI
jgi:hypothetical protein